MIFVPLPFIPNEEEFSLFGFNFSLFVDIHDWTEAKRDCRAFSAAPDLPDENEIYS